MQAAGEKRGNNIITTSSYQLLYVKMHLSNLAASHVWHALNYLDRT